MKELPIISVVMPAYNAGMYIRKAIDSILAQDFGNFELIVADDCSTDNTVQIVESYSDCRIRLIQTEKNSGSAKYPRELAIEQACAPYICWIDSDDEIDKDYLSLMLQRKQESGADIVCSHMLAERDGTVQYELPQNGFDYGQIISGRDAVKMTLGSQWEININGWLCDKELWTGISTFKDISIVHMDADDFSAREILFSASKVAFSPAIYHYRLHPSAITKKLSYKRFESVITDRLVLQFMKENLWGGVLPIINKSLCLRMISLIRLYAIHKSDMKSDDSQRAWKLLKLYYKKISCTEIFSNDMPLKFKLMLLLPFEFSYLLIKIINKS